MEKVLFDERQVTVTDKRFVNENVVIPISAIVSIRLDKGSIQSGVSSWPLFLIALPLPFLLAYGSYLYLIIMVLAFFAALYYWSSQNKSSTFYTIFVSTSGGDKQGVVSEDLEFVEKVFKVLNEVLISKN